MSRDAAIWPRARFVESMPLGISVLQAISQYGFNTGGEFINKFQRSREPILTSSSLCST